MGSMVTLTVIAASATLEPSLQATSWEGQVAAVFRPSLLRTATDGRLFLLHTGPCLAFTFSLRTDAGIQPRP